MCDECTVLVERAVGCMGRFTHIATLTYFVSNIRKDSYWRVDG